MFDDGDEETPGCGSYLRDEIVESDKAAVGLMNSMFDEMLNSGEFSDLTITAGQGEDKREFRVHKNILARHSGYFKNLCYGTGSFKENDSGVVDYPDDDPLIIEKVIGFIYKGHYLEEVRPLATDRFAYWINQDLFNRREEEACKDVVEALDYIWGNRGHADRDVLLVLPVARHLDKLINREDFKELIVSHPDLSTLLLRAYHENTKFDDKHTAEYMRKGQSAPVWCGKCQAMMEMKLYCHRCNRTKYVSSEGAINGWCYHDDKRYGVSAAV